MSMTKAELEAKVSELEEDNERLRAELAAAGGTMAGTPRRPAPVEPSFGMSEGERADLEQTGRATSPFTGDVRVGTPDDHTVTPAKDAAAAELDTAGGETEHAVATPVDESDE